MHLLGRSALLCALVGLLCFAIGEAAFAKGFSSQDVRIPVGENRYTIAARILKPEGAGPFGAVVLNHGVAGTRAERMRESPDQLLAAAAVFVEHGFVVVMPLRRGFGVTGGDYAEDPGPCSNPDFRKAETAASEDVMAAYNYARTLPYVDGKRMLLAGQSAGAMVSIYAAATRAPEGLLAVLGFAAGRGGNPDYRPGVPCAIEPVAKLLENVGQSIKVPVLFHYAANDRFFNAETTRLWFERFKAGGAKADYVLQPAFGADGHYVFSAQDGAKVWLPAVESFLDHHGVAFGKPKQPDRVVPAELPAPKDAERPRPSDLKQVRG
jgi:dienelactone hydrolase